MADASKKKQSRKERQRELRMLEKSISGGKSVIDYGKVNEVCGLCFSSFSLWCFSILMCAKSKCRTPV